MIKINTLQELKNWNMAPTEEAPIVGDWYYDWIFDECLKKKDFEYFRDAYDTMVNFTIICEKMNRSDSMERLNSNLRFWYHRASKDAEPFKTYFNKLLLMYNGV